MYLRPVILSLALFGSVALASQPDPKSSDSIASILKDQFTHWDKQGTGKLTREQVDALVSNHSVKGDVAAAVAALHVYYRDNPKAGPLTQSFVMESAATNLPKERRDQANKIQHFQADYLSFKNHIQSAPKELFVDKAPQLLGMSQGNLGDCFFVSMVGAAVHFDHERVKKMIHPVKEGVWEVDFIDGSKTTVRLTDAQIALGSNAGQQGLWLNVLEEAFGHVRFRKTPKKEPGDIAIDVISRGGSSSDAIAVLTGHKTASMDCTAHSTEPITVGMLKAHLNTGLKAHRLLSASTADKATLPPGMVTGHCYAVLGYDAKKDKISMWNPWGNNFQPKKGLPGMENGFAVKDGHFEVTPYEFMKIFDWLTYEINEPLKPAPKK
jgi:hypothetical protein